MSVRYLWRRPEKRYKLCIESAGIDWITATEKLGKWRGNLLPVGQEILDREQTLGNEVREWRWMGYRGQVCGGVSVGVRQGSALVQLRSDVARDNWKPIALNATNVSRLDLQVTYSMGQALPNAIARAKSSADRANKISHWPTTVQFLTSQQTGDTLYLGKRSSPVFGRFYDKGVESGLASPGWLLRQELELKQDCSLGTANMLLQEADPVSMVGAVVESYFRSRGVYCGNEFAGVYKQVGIARAAQVRDRSGVIGWLYRSVRPVVGRLKNAGRLREVLDALEVTDEDLDEMRSSELGQWSM